MVVRLDAGEGGARRGGGDQSPVVRVLRKHEAIDVSSEVIDEMYEVGVINTNQGHLEISNLVCHNKQDPGRARQNFT